MDPSTFDTLVRSFATDSTRRRLVRVLAALSLGGVVTASEDVSAGEHPRDRLQRRTKQRNRKQRNRRQRNQNNNQNTGGGSGGGGGGGGGGGSQTPDPNLGAPPPSSCPSPCPATTVCDGGSCQPCDVCASGCAFIDVQTAINDPAQLTTIRICPGTYPQFASVTIGRSLSLIGGGGGTLEGAGTGVTILQGKAQGSVVFIPHTAQRVTLQGLRITGGTSVTFGGGILHANPDGALLMIDCTVIGNTAGGEGEAGTGGGIFSEGDLSLTACLVTGNTAKASSQFGSGSGGGIFSEGDVSLDPGGTFIFGNSPDDCAGAGFGREIELCGL